MDSIGGFIDPSISTPRPSTPISSSSSNQQTSTSTSTTSSSTNTTQEQSNTTIDLDKEVQNVIAGFGSFWGKVRKQSTAAFFTAEKQFESTLSKDLNPLLSKAKANLDTFSATARAEVQRLSEVQAPSGQSGVVIGPDGVPVIVGDDNEESKPLDKGKGVDRSQQEAQSSSSQEQTQAQEMNPSAAASAFFSRLQSQFSHVQTPQALANLSSNFQQLQQQLSHLDLGQEGQKTTKLAEEYLHRGEAWFGEFREEVSRLAKDAVTIVPPTSTSTAAGGGGGERTIESTRSQGDSNLSLMTKSMSRKDLLLYKLRCDVDLLRQDPSLPPLPSSTDLTDYRQRYFQFLSSLESQDFEELVERVRREGGEVLEKTFMEVTRSKEGGGGSEQVVVVGDEEFWKRYLFRLGLIEEEEEKRKQVLSVEQSQEDDDFTWDLDDEEQQSNSATSPPLSTTTATTTLPPPSLSSKTKTNMIVDSIPPTTIDTSHSSSHPQTKQPSSPIDATPLPLASSSVPIQPSHSVDTTTSSTVQPPLPPPSTSTSPRTSSSEGEEGGSTTASTRASYDLVGERSGNPSVDGDSTLEVEERDAVVGEGKKVEQGEEEDEDSDWE